MFTLLTNIVVISGFYINCQGYVKDFQKAFWTTDDNYLVELYCEKNNVGINIETWLPAKLLKEVK